MVSKKKRKSSPSPQDDNVSSPAPVVRPATVSKKKRKGSPSSQLPDDSDSSLAPVGVDRNADMEKRLAALESKYEMDMKKLRPVRKQFVIERSIALVNEFISFIAQIHGAGVQKQYEKGSISVKYDQLIGNKFFEADCQVFFSHEGDSEKTARDLVGVFTKVCNERNGQTHYPDPEDCISAILKFEKKNQDLLHKCSEEVRYILPRILEIARHFIGPYRLRRLTCQYLGRFLVSKGLSWTDFKELETVLDKNRSLIKQFKPKNVSFAYFKFEILRLFQESKLVGPRWTGFSPKETSDFVAIQECFENCLKVDVLPAKATHCLEYSVLEHIIV